MLRGGILILQIGHLSESFFDYVFEVLSENLDLGLSLVVSSLIMVLDEVLPHFLADVKLDGVIASSDGLDIPLNVLVLED